ncbi:MAG: NYN domain-containing protein [bacterium]
MLTIIIDGNNLIHKIPSLITTFKKDKEGAQLSLIETVVSRTGKDKVIFVFDGHGNLRRPNVIFSESSTADDVIRKKIENFTNPKSLKIVSSDNGITGLAKVCGCKTQKSEEFWKDINIKSSAPSGENINQNFIYDKLEKPERMSKKEIDEFRKFFT